MQAKGVATLKSAVTERRFVRVAAVDALALYPDAALSTCR